MKNLITMAIAILFSVNVNAQDKVIGESQLPDAAKTYLKKHFSDAPVMQVTLDKDFFSKSYEVILRDNIKIEFDSDGKVKEIDGNAKLPNSVIPANILAYVQKNYPQNHITDWELESRKQQVSLDNGMDLEFNLQGQFLRIDN